MPSPPSPPALLTAAASAGVLALPIGACRIGHWLLTYLHIFQQEEYDGPRFLRWLLIPDRAREVPQFVVARPECVAFEDLPRPRTPMTAPRSSRPTHCNSIGRFSLSVRALEGHMLPPLALPPSVAERASAVRVPVAVAQDAAGEGAGVLLILEQHLAVDDRVCDAFRGLLDTPAAGREVVHNLFLAALHGGGIEDRDVGRHARPQQAAVIEAKGRCRVEGQTAHRLLQAHHLLLAHPLAEQLGDIAVAAVKLDMRAAVAEPDDRVGMGQDL